MSHEQGHDDVTDAARRLLDCACRALATSLGGEIDRCCLLTGDVAWDDCCDGQAWVRVLRVYPSTAFPQEDRESHRCRSLTWAGELEVGVLRCACTIGDDGSPPDCDCLSRDALVVLDDARALRQAVVCCFAAGGSPAQVAIGEWTPLGPDGGCVGGVMTVTVPASTCRCT